MQDPYEAPVNPDGSVDTTQLSVDQAVGRILDVWAERVWGRPVTIGEYRPAIKE